VRRVPWCHAARPRDTVFLCRFVANNLGRIRVVGQPGLFNKFRHRIFCLLGGVACSFETLAPRGPGFFPARYTGWLSRNTFDAARAKHGQRRGHSRAHGGGYTHVLCLSFLTIDHASSREWSIIATGSKITDGQSLLPAVPKVPYSNW
ncbi:unnamed protein product, partial [Ectocarpus sp. 4 AP-2014]